MHRPAQNTLIVHSKYSNTNRTHDSRLPHAAAATESVFLTILARSPINVVRCGVGSLSFCFFD